MQVEDVVELYTLLLNHGVQLWIDGGWGVDALLKQQTRPHKDLDAFVRLDNLANMAELLAQHGFHLKEIWSENRWIGHALAIPLIGGQQPDGRTVATAFVLRDEKGRELDIHVLTFDQRGFGIPAWNAELTFPPDAFEGCGTIAGTSVCCLSAHMHILTHTGYTLLDKDLQDLRLLRERFGISESYD